MSEDMRGLFFIVKGQYERRSGKSFVNRATGETNHIGGYDPYSDTTPEWYMLVDTKTYTCVMCGTKLDKIMRGVYTIIKKYKGDAGRYFKNVIDTSAGYPKVSPMMRCLYEEVYREYGDYFRDRVKEMEDLAYTELVEERPVNKSRKLMARTKTNTLQVVETTPVEKKTVEDITPKKVTPKVKLGVKKLSMD